MQVIFESRDADGAQLRDLSVERVHFALRRLTPMPERWSLPRWHAIGALRWTAHWGAQPGY